MNKTLSLILPLISLILLTGCPKSGGGTVSPPYIPGPFDGVWRTDCMPDGYGNSWAYEIRVANEEHASVGFYKFSGTTCNTEQEQFSRLTTLTTAYSQRSSAGIFVDKIVSQEWVRPKTQQLRSEFIAERVCGLQNAWLDERGIDVAGLNCDPSWTVVKPYAKGTVQQDLWKAENGHLVVGDLFVFEPNSRPTSVNSVIFNKIQ